MSNKLLDKAEASIIGNLEIYPELFDCLYIKSEYFEEPFRPLISAMVQSMDKNNALIVEQLIKTPGFNIDLYMDCANLGMHRDRKKFMQLQSFLLDKYKQRAIISLSNDLKNGSIDLMGFTKSYQSIIKLSPNTAIRLTKDKLLDACNTKEDKIWFSRFQKFGSSAKISQKDFVILAAATGVGKTTVALNLALDLARYYEIDYFNLEMPEYRLLRRMVALSSDVPMKEIGSIDKLDDLKKEKIEEAMKYINEKSINLINESQTVESIRSYVAAHEGKRHRIVFIDHIGLISSNHRTAYERMTEIAKELRRISLDYNCTIIGLCQLHRLDAKRDTKPSLSMLRDSGEIEQSARKVVFVWRDNNDYSIVIEKNDEGPTGIVDIVYNKETQRISESASQYGGKK